MTIEYKDLKKNDEVKTTQLGTPVSGKLIESPKQGRGLKSYHPDLVAMDQRLACSDEHGSVYAHEVSLKLKEMAPGIR